MSYDFTDDDRNEMRNGSEEPGEREIQSSMQDRTMEAPSVDFGAKGVPASQKPYAPVKQYAGPQTPSNQRF